jgi:hypothetical protein
MARIISRCLNINELDDYLDISLEQAAPSSKWASFCSSLQSVPLLVWVGLATFGLPWNPPLVLFAVVALLSYRLLCRLVKAEESRGLYSLTRGRRLPQGFVPRELAETERVGLEGELVVLQALTRLPDEFVILHDVRLPVGGRDTQLDLVVLSPYGVWCLEIKAWRGRVYGQATEPNWTLVKLYGRELHKTRLSNPLLQNQYHCDSLQAYLSRQGYDVGVQALVVFTTAELQVSAAGAPLVSLPGLLKELQCTAAPGRLALGQVNELGEQLAAMLGEGVALVAPSPSPTWVSSREIQNENADADSLDIQLVGAAGELGTMRDERPAAAGQQRERSAHYLTAGKVALTLAAIGVGVKWALLPAWHWLESHNMPPSLALLLPGLFVLQGVSDELRRSRKRRRRQN